MTNPQDEAPVTNGQAFINAAQSVIQAAQTLQTGDNQADTATAVQTILGAVGANNPSLTDAVQAILAPARAQKRPVICPQPPDYTTDVDGTTFNVSLPPPQGDQLPLLGTEAQEDFFGGSGSNGLETFFVNLAASIAAIFAIFGGVAQIQSREILDEFNAVRQSQLLSPADLADMVERNILCEEDGAQEAAGSGVNATRFHNMVLDAGEPPGPVQMLELLRRDLIEGDRFAQAIAYSRVKTDYIPDLLKLVYQTMSAADAVNLFVKGVPVTPGDFTTQGLDPPDTTDPDELRNQFAAAMFRRAGGLPSQWDLLKTGAGDSVGVVHATQLLHHGLINQDQWTEIVGRSRVNPIFYYAVAMSDRRWLGNYQLGEVVAADPSLLEWGITQMIENGYPADQARYYIEAKAGGSAAKAKNATEAAVIEQYEVGSLTADQAKAELKTLGYTDAAQGIILAAADARLQLSIHNSAIGRVRSAYLAGHIDLAKARTELTNLNITDERIGWYLAAWQVEVDTRTRTLTEGQIGSLARKGRIGHDAAVAKWEAMGFSAEDADLLWQDYEPTSSSLARNVPAPGTPA